MHEADPRFAGACAFPRRGSERLAAIDVGSNSVRLLLLGERDEKYVETTRLSAGFNASGELSEESMRRTAEAVADFAAQARAFCGGVFVFGTEAVRKAKNRARFLELVRERAGCALEVLGGDEEANCGFLGVSDGRTRISVLDIGGASTELAVGGECLEASRSLAVGTVRLLDACGRDRAKVEAFADRILPGFADLPHTETLSIIGGTATTIASTLLALPVYDREKVQGFRVERSALETLSDKLFALEIPEISKLPGMDPRRADVIAGGAALLLRFMQRYGFAAASVSETDNLEGYLRLRGYL